MRARKTLLMVAPTAKFFRSHRLPIALAAKDAGYRVAVACPTDSDSELLALDGLEHLPLAINRSGLGMWAQWQSLRGLFGVFRRERPDVVHLITAKPVLLGGIAARLLGIPTVAAVTGLGYLFVRSDRTARTIRKLLLTAYRFALNRPDTVFIFQNDNDREIFASSGLLQNASVVMIPGSGVDLERITPQPLPPPPAIVLLPCRMLRDKGVVEFVEAARLLRERGYDATFRLLGDPDAANPASLTQSELEAFAEDGYVQWSPFEADIASALAQSTIVCLPSYREGFPKTLIDAAAAGRAMVATDVPGCRDAIVPGLTGILCEARSAASLAAAVESLLSQPSLVEAMGKAARKDAEARFDIRQVVARHLEIYSSLILSR